LSTIAGKKTYLFNDLDCQPAFIVGSGVIIVMRLDSRNTDYQLTTAATSDTEIASKQRIAHSECGAQFVTGAVLNL
jgi:hypothetical protein